MEVQVLVVQPRTGIYSNVTGDWNTDVTLDSKYHLIVDGIPSIIFDMYRRLRLLCGVNGCIDLIWIEWLMYLNVNQAHHLLSHCKNFHPPNTMSPLTDMIQRERSVPYSLPTAQSNFHFSNL
jgi:hypothetical protein